MIKKYLGLTLVTASLLFMGCSSDDDDDDNGTTTPEAAAAADSYTPPDGVAQDIVATLQADPRFSVLVEAVVAADLAGALSAELSDTQPGLTVFAPTNEAMEAAGVTSESIADGSAGGDITGLTNILQYHVASGAYDAQQLADNTGKLLTMLNGQTALIDGGLQGGETDGTETDGTETDGTETDGTETDGIETDGIETDGIETDGIETDGIETDGTETDGTETDGTETDGTETDGTETTQSDDETAGEETGDVETLAKAADDPLSVAGVEVAEADLFATNGVIHVIETVLTPPETDTDGGTDNGDTPTGSNLFDVIGQDQNLTTLSTLLTATELNLTLNDPANTFTVFAPTDAAFNELGQETLDSLSANPDAANPILLYHVSEGESTSQDLIALDGGTLAMSNGQSADIAVVDGQVTINGATVTQSDIQADNGIVHIIDGVLTPDDTGAAEDDSQTGDSDDQDDSTTEGEETTEGGETVEGEEEQPVVDEGV